MGLPHLPRCPALMAGCCNVVKQQPEMTFPIFIYIFLMLRAALDANPLAAAQTQPVRLRAHPASSLGC